MLKRKSISLGWLGAIVLGVSLVGCSASSPLEATKEIRIQLNRGPLTLHDFPAKRIQPLATIIFASGDGGWGDLEDSIALGFQARGFEIIGLDCEDYAQTDYSMDTLQSDFRKIAETVQSPYGNHKPPLIVGGYSMGAAQAIAVAGGPHPPPGLVGLLLVDPCSRGRYGLRVSDQMNVLPTGSGTFAVADFAHTLGSIRVVQWHADDDSIDSRSWLDLLTAEHRAYTFPNDGHSYDNNRDDFIRKLIGSVDWILSSAPASEVKSR